MQEAPLELLKELSVSSDLFRARLQPRLLPEADAPVRAAVSLESGCLLSGVPMRFEPFGVVGSARSEGARTGCCLPRSIIRAGRFCSGWLPCDQCASGSIAIGKAAAFGFEHCADASSIPL